MTDWGERGGSPGQQKGPRTPQPRQRLDHSIGEAPGESYVEPPSVDFARGSGPCMRTHTSGCSRHSAFYDQEVTDSATAGDRPARLEGLYLETAYQERCPTVLGQRPALCPVLARI